MYESLDHAINLYCGTFQAVSMYVEDAFLNHCRALEVYHHQKYNDSYIPDDTFDKFRNDLENILYRDVSNIFSLVESVERSGPTNLREKYSIESDFIDHLKDGTFKYSNQYSLRKRIKLLTEEHEEILTRLPHNALGDHQKIADTRNYFTHYDEDGREDAATDDELHEYRWKVQQLIEVCLLNDLGIPQGLIIDRLQSQYRDRRVI